jgi:hypothetical protein
MSLQLHGELPVKRLPPRVRPKGADMDRPEGYGKILLRRQLRRDLKRNVHPVGCRCTDCDSLSLDAIGRRQEEKT